ncbi:Ku protein [Streptomyces sp. NPDC091649]|uniref:non-homologous end joining protein Ku n=1 Tax=Streptomyces sp. NPDC091649 TaxID=3366004 RepID=UPI003811E3B0
MRSIWNGAISFGLVSIPIKLINATENHSIHFRQIHLADGGRIRYRKVCEVDEEEVASGEIGKAYEDADGTMIPITDEDLAQLPLPTAKTIEIVAFVPADRIDPLQMDTAYYLSANGVPAAKPYTLLREALQRSNKVAVAKYALRGRERLGMLRVVDDVIAMHGLLWPDEIRAPEEVAPDGDVTVRDAELDLADALMDTLGGVDMDSLHDDYREAVEELIAAKAAGETVPAAPTEDGGGKVIDLIAALENSVRAARKSSGEEGAETEAQEEGDGDMADVHPIKKTASRTSGTSSGGASDTSSASASSSGKAAKKTTKTTHRTPTGKTVTRSGSSTTKKPAPKSTGTKKSTSTAKKSGAGDGSSGSRTAAKKSTAKKSTAEKSRAEKGTAKKQSSSTGGAAAKKTASSSSRKRASA